MAVLMAMLFVRKVFWVVEQPHTSVRWLLPEWPLLTEMRPLEKVFLWLGSYGHGGLKPSVFWTTLGTFASLKRPKPIEAKSQEQPLWVKKNEWGRIENLREFPHRVLRMLCQRLRQDRPLCAHQADGLPLQALFEHLQCHATCD